MSDETRSCPGCVRLAEDVERQKRLTVAWANEAQRIQRDCDDLMRACIEMAATADAASAALRDGAA